MRLLLKLAIFLSLMMLAACASRSFSPRHLTLPDELRGVQSSTLADVSFSVSILADNQARQHIGVDLGNYGVQAIWIHIANRSPDHLWSIRNHLDRDVYSPDEVAVMTESEVADDEFHSLRQLLRDESIRISIPQNTLTQGFVFAPKHEGGRYIDIRLLNFRLQDLLYEIPAFVGIAKSRYSPFNALNSSSVQHGVRYWGQVQSQAFGAAEAQPEIRMQRQRPGFLSSQAAFAG